MNIRPTLREIRIRKKKLELAIAHWKLKMVNHIGKGESPFEKNLKECEVALVTLNKYVAGVGTFPNRNTMTKKKQRALGILPNVTKPS